MPIYNFFFFKIAVLLLACHQFIVGLCRTKTGIFLLDKHTLTLYVKVTTQVQEQTNCVVKQKLVKASAQPGQKYCFHFLRACWVQSSGTEK